MKPPAMPPTPILETEHLWLRPKCLADSAATDVIFPNWNIVQFMPNVPWPYPQGSTLEHYQTALAEMSQGLKSHWSLFLKGGPDTTIGSISLWPDDGLERDMRGFWLDPHFQGRGLITQAADRVNDYGLFELHWPLLWLSNLVGNERSAKVKLRQGAELVGEDTRSYLRGTFTRQVWRLTQDAWKERRRPSYPAE